MTSSEVAIVGATIPAVGQTLPDETSMTLTIKAVLGALADAGIEKREVNGACINWSGPGGSPLGGSTNWARQLGGPLNWVIEDGLDATGIRGVLNATAAIQSGLCETVVVASAVAGQGAFGGGGAGLQPKHVPSAAYFEFADPFGAGIIQRFAMTARRHMHDYGTTPAQLAEVAATIRNFGHINPEATMFGRGPYSVDDILNSRMIADPLHLLDCGLTGQGGAALVLTTSERARALGVTPVYILGGAMELSQGPHATPSLNNEGMLGARRMQTAFQKAGITVDDVDMLSLYDATSFEVIRNLEMLGFCPPGEGGPFVEDGALALDGRIPTNTDGGLLSHGFAMTAQLIMKIVEAVRQLRGQCGPRQVTGASVAVCTNSVATAHHIEALILGKG